MSAAYFADQLRTLRKRRKWTQAQVAKAVDTTQANVSRWEKGEYLPSPAIALSVAYRLGVEPEQLFGTVAREWQRGSPPPTRLAEQPAQAKTDAELCEALASLFADFASLPPAYRPIVVRDIRNHFEEFMSRVSNGTSHA